MLIVKKDDFEKWVKEQKWLALQETPTPQGRQIMYLTPAGNFVVGARDIKGELIGVGPVVVQAQPSGPAPHGLDFRGGRQFPP
jgi:hypothetical protein